MSSYEQFIQDYQDAPVWGQHYEESNDDYFLFRQFWIPQQGKRTIRRAIELHDRSVIADGRIPRNKDRPDFAKLSRLYYWRERGSAYDEFEYQLEVENIIQDLKYVREQRMKLIRTVLDNLNTYLDTKGALASANAIKVALPAISGFIGHLRREEQIIAPTVSDNRELEKKITIVRTELTKVNPNEHQFTNDSRFEDEDDGSQKVGGLLG